MEVNLTRNPNIPLRQQNETLMTKESMRISKTTKNILNNLKGKSTTQIKSKLSKQFFSMRKGKVNAIKIKDYSRQIRKFMLHFNLENCSIDKKNQQIYSVIYNDQILNSKKLNSTQNISLNGKEKNCIKNSKKAVNNSEKSVLSSKKSGLLKKKVKFEIIEKKLNTTKKGLLCFSLFSKNSFRNLDFHSKI